MKPKLVIVGAGIGGCFLADGLAESWEIRVVEFAAHSPYLLQQRVRDTDTAAVTYPHIGSGLGGTTAFWHNGLMEVDEEVFERKWPFLKSELDRYYARAYPKLAGASLEIIAEQADALRQKYTAIGLPGDLLGHGLFYPQRTVNAWNDLNLKGRVTVVEGEVVDIVPAGTSAIDHLLVRNGDREVKIDGDVFVLAAGGLGTPLLIQKLAAHLPLPALRQAGLHYEDHPSVVVGEVVLDEPLYKLWNYPASRAKGNLRLPLVIKQDGLQISFQLRPAAHFWIINPRNRLKTVLHELRHAPFKLRPYFLLFTHWDDVLEILSFKFGVRLPTRHYSLIMVAEQTPSDTRAVWREDGSDIIYRQWTLSGSYIDTLQRSIDRVLDMLNKKIKSASIFPDWPDHVTSSSHHSGTARMAATPDQGVCDENGRVHGLRNLYVCDGSLIPASGYANTGLTIAALAMRMADWLKRTAPNGN